MVSLGDIQAARERIRGAIRQTPVLYSEILSREAGNQLFLKLENLNVTGSYKERGALKRFSTLSAEERARGVITASAGNHAQAVAYHASQRGIRAQICMPEYTPLVKVTATRAWGAEVILYGANYDEALEEARRRCRPKSGVSPRLRRSRGDRRAGHHRAGAAGAASGSGCGGGAGGRRGLIAGIACAVKETRPDVRIVGVEPQALPSMEAALLQRKPVMLPAAATIADGIAVRQVGELTLELALKYVREVVTVDDEEIARAILRFWKNRKCWRKARERWVWRRCCTGKPRCAGKRSRW